MACRVLCLENDQRFQRFIAHRRVYSALNRCCLDFLGHLVLLGPDAPPSFRLPITHKNTNGGDAESANTEIYLEHNVVRKTCQIYVQIHMINMQLILDTVQ